ncbi:MAG: alkaline phosphatase [Bacteroidetes bacterium]|nr:MAG: alkaline phosphatase [Bacteroidota bacterium]
MKQLSMHPLRWVFAIVFCGLGSLYGQVPGDLGFTAASQSVAEDTGTVMIMVELTGSPTDTVRAQLALTTFATATSGADFMSADTVNLTFVPGVAFDTLMVPIMDDADAENDEYFSLRLINPENADISGTAAQIVYIRDNDRLAPAPSGAISLNLLTSYSNTPGAVENSAEIVAYMPATQRLYVANSVNNSLDLVDFSDPAAPAPVNSIDLSALGEITSVAVYDTLVATALANATDPVLDGSIGFFDADGNLLAQVTVGALPDMVTFTPDGSKVLAAIEGQPSDDYLTDPEGAVAIVDLSGGIAGLSQADVTLAGFTAYNAQQATLEANGVRISAPGATVAEDMEPEYITVSEDGLTAWVTCQENNAVAVADLVNDTIVAVLGMGTKDWSLPGAGLDATNVGDEIHIANYPVKGLYLPDAIASYSVGGVTYLITANEGDAREYDAFVDEARLGDTDYELDSAAFPNGDLLKAAIGRMKTLVTEGDTDNDGDFDEIYGMGGRSFTIWDGATGALVYDSGDMLELITSQDPVFGAIFNANEDGIEPKNRSDDKGPEPEGVATGVINGRTYSFLALERIGGVMVHDVTDPVNPVFVQYVNNRSTTTETGDLAPEGLLFIPANESPSGQALLVPRSGAHRWGHDL